MVPDGSRKSGSAPAGQDPAQHLVGGPLDGRHGGDAEPLVDLGAPGVVDAGHDLLDAEGLAGHPRGDDVGVVAAGDRRERVRPTDAGLLQDLLVEAVAGHPVAVEARAEPSEGVGLAVDHRHRVVPVLEAARQGRTDPATAHDHHVHERTVSQPRRRCRADATRCRTDRRIQGLLSCHVGVGDVSKRILLGRKLRSSQLGETLLPKRIALPVFASDALSSVAYAPDEIFLMLSVAGFSAYAWSWKIGLAVAVVLLTVVTSYRQTVHAYPSGGGDYEVATVNLGPQRRRHRGQRPARRLHPHGGRVDLLGGAVRRLGDPGAARPRADRRDRPGHPAGRA